jgi:hypothetical protein
MKKIIATIAFLAFGTVFMTAQTTSKTETKSTTKNVEQRSKKSIQQDNAPKMVDTANIEQRQKEADEKVAQPAIPRRDGATDETTKPQAQPAPGQLE